MKHFLILALLLAGCSKRETEQAPPAAMATRKQSVISVTDVEKVRITSGFEVITNGQKQVVNDGVLLRVSGLDPAMFEPRAMVRPAFIVGSSIAKVVVNPLATMGEARVLAPLPPAGSQATVWLTLPGVVATNMDATALAQEQQRAVSATGYWYTFTAPSATATTRQFATLNELKAAEQRLSLTGTQCEQELGKQCGTILNSRLGPVDCGYCAMNQTCMPDNLCCTKTTCAQQGGQCGTLSDGCGGTIFCPCACPANEPYRCCDNVTCSATKGCPEVACNPPPGGGEATE
ncbi:hypothetical protein JY651_22395 [Pyxidicoccus parkwayensis]|uniref:Lipoprotein n=1 Tax=Pyxidicoccus parkwayensis TaxID=2813578 RepID=A0ABX7PAQ3_9BACT|nr:hypothetical protein [Pyxidicoccus parkwaysis]QSQ27493.1 hypothetical protein JY651_22395 [Pyxidicoccus parkwaysis]